MRPARFHHVAQRVTNGIASEARSSHHDGRRQRQQRMNVVRVHHCCLMCLRADTASPATGPVTCVLRVGFSHWRASLRGASTQDPHTPAPSIRNGLMVPTTGGRQWWQCTTSRARAGQKKVWTDCSSPVSYRSKSACFRAPPGCLPPSFRCPGWSSPFPSGTERFRSCCCLMAHKL